MHTVSMHIPLSNIAKVGYKQRTVDQHCLNQVYINLDGIEIDMFINLVINLIYKYIF
jgi:hypothetical protein